jgi:hypothetical protein
MSRPFIEDAAVPGSEQWLCKRPHMVLATDASVLAGCSRHTTPEELRRQKLEEKKLSPQQLKKRSDEKNAANPHIRAGHANESFLGKWAWNNCFDTSKTTLYHPRMYVAPPPRNWEGATPDFSVFSKEANPTQHIPVALIECKFSLVGAPESPKIEHLMQVLYRPSQSSQSSQPSQSSRPSQSSYMSDTV